MAETLLSEQIRDTNTHTANTSMGFGYQTNASAVFHVVNDLDAEVTVTFYGTRDGDTSFNDIEQIGSLTIAADSSDYEVLTDHWDVVYVEVVASTTPTTDQVDIYVMP